MIPSETSKSAKGIIATQAIQGTPSGFQLVPITARNWKIGGGSPRHCYTNLAAHLSAFMRAVLGKSAPSEVRLVGTL